MTEKRSTDGGYSATRFEEVDWEEIDATNTPRTLRRTVWYAIVAAWTFGFFGNLFVHYVMHARTFHEIPGTDISTGLAVLEADWLNVIPLFGVRGGWIDFPLVGVVALHDWMWSITLAGIIYYGVIPLYENQRMTQYYWTRFKKNKAAVISAIFIVVSFFVGVIGSRVTETPRPQPGLDNQPPAWMEVQSWVVGTQCPGGLEGAPPDEMCHGSWDYPLGTTTSGEDLFLGIIHGMEISLMVGLTATVISTVIAASLALIAVYYGGRVDEVIFRWVDIQLTFPAFFLYLLIVYSLGGSLFILILVFGFIEWGGGARIMRSEALQRREEPYVTASKAAGAKPSWTMRRHLLPNISNSIITYMSLSIPAIILAEAALSFLGLGDPTVHSWGQLIADGRDRLGSAWWISTFPGVALFLTVLAFNFVGDALRDAIDPRHQGAKE